MSLCLCTSSTYFVKDVCVVLSSGVQNMKLYEESEQLDNWGPDMRGSVGPADESTHLKHNGRKSSPGRVPGQFCSSLQVSQLQMASVMSLWCDEEFKAITEKIHRWTVLMDNVNAMTISSTMLSALMLCQLNYADNHYI